MFGMVTKVFKKKKYTNRSYGFISAYDGESYWFNLKGLEDIKVGDEVSFSGSVNGKGLVARYVKKVTEEN